MPTIQNFLQDQYAATAATRCIKVYIPDDDSYVPLLGGLLALAASPENYQEPESAQAEGVAAIWKDAYLQTDWEGCGTPPECQQMSSELTIQPWTMNVITGNAIVFAADANQYGNGFMTQNPAILGQQLQTYRFMAAGNWAYSILCRTTTTSGQLRLQINDPDGTINYLDHDLYSNPAVNNVRKTGTFAINEDGQAIINLLASGKHASSSGYILFVSEINLWRTS